jgi:uncharacterized protein
MTGSRIPMLFLSLVVAFVAAIPPSSAHSQAPPMRVLVLTGQDNAHDWDANSSRIIENLAGWGIRDVERQAMRSDEDWRNWTGDYSAYDLVVLMYYTANAPTEPIQALADHVAGGGSIVVVHSALAGLTGHEAFDRMIGVGWRGADYGSSLAFGDTGERIVRAPGEGRGASHPPLMDFTVHARDREHPIMQGIPDVWMQAHDELYYHLRGPVGEMHVLATSQPPNGDHAPILWTIRHGDGRVFVTTLGHHLPSVESLGFMTTLVRGMEWAATGQVTTPVPANFPGADAPVREAPVFE